MLDARVKLAFLAVFVVACLHARTAASLGLCMGVALALAIIVHLQPRELRAVLVPLGPILVLTVVFQVLAGQEGVTLVELGGLRVTEEALLQSVRMLACLLALMLASISFMRCASTEDLMSALRWLLSPLRRVGVRVDAFMLSLSVALGFLPVLTGEFQRLKAAQQARLASFDGTLRERLQAYLRLIAPLLQGGFHHADNLADAFLSRGFSCGPVPTQLHARRFGAGDACCLIAATALCCIVFAIG
jgi:energy-coupling factor transport system permease protein